MNKYQEAYKTVVKLKPKNLLFTKIRKANKLVKQACEKAEKYDELKTPKKPIKHYKGFYRCVNCEEIFQNYHYQICCPYCGQALDWSDEND